MPRSYERTYKQGRTLASALQALGWLLVGAGLLVAVLGFSSGAAPYAMLDGAGIMARLLACVPGPLIVFFGLIALHCSHTARATYDTAELTRDLLGRSRKTADAPATATTAAVTPAPRPHPGGRAEPALRRPSTPG